MSRFDIHKVIFSFFLRVFVDAGGGSGAIDSAVVDRRCFRHPLFFIPVWRAGVFWAAPFDTLRAPPSNVLRAAVCDTFRAADFDTLRTPHTESLNNRGGG